MAAAAGATTLDVAWPPEARPAPLPVRGVRASPSPTSASSVAAVVRGVREAPTPSAASASSSAASPAAAVVAARDGCDADGGGGGAPDVTAHFRAHAFADPYLLLHKSIYFAGMGANGCFYPFIVIYLKRHGLGADSVGVILAASHTAALFVTPVLTRAADVSEASRRAVLVGGAAGWILLYFLLQYTVAYGFWATLATVVAADAVNGATWPIVDASTMALLTARDGKTAAYGQSRAFGAVGWGVYAWAAGALYDRLGSLDSIFTTFLLCALPLLPLLARLPLERRGAGGAGSAVEAAARGALWRVDVAVFLLVVVIIAALLFVVDTYRLPFLASLGASNSLLGASITATAVSEAPCFFLAPWVLDRVPTPAILLAVLVAYVGRYAWYAAMTDPLYTMPMELLHGVQFAFGWAASVAYVDTLLPPELSSSAQGILAAAQWGVGSSLGAVAGGYIYEAYGARALFRAWIGLALAGTVVMAASVACSARGARAGAGGLAAADALARKDEGAGARKGSATANAGASAGASAGARRPPMVSTSLDDRLH